MSAPIGGCISEPVWSARTEPLPNITERPSVLLLDVGAMGPIRRPLTAVAGECGFRWFVTAGLTDCRIAVVLDGPAGSLTIDDYGRVAARQSASSLAHDIRLDAAMYTVRLDTDCPGESHLWVGRYQD